MRDKILAVLEKNARIDIHELATLLGEPQITFSFSMSAISFATAISGSPSRVASS